MLGLTHYASQVAWLLPQRQVDPSEVFKRQGMRACPCMCNEMYPLVAVGTADDAVRRVGGYCDHPDETRKQPGPNLRLWEWRKEKWGEQGDLKGSRS